MHAKKKTKSRRTTPTNSISTTFARTSREVTRKRNEALNFLSNIPTTSNDEKRSKNKEPTTVLKETEPKQRKIEHTNEKLSISIPSGSNNDDSPVTKKEVKNNAALQFLTNIPLKNEGTNHQKSPKHVKTNPIEEIEVKKKIVTSPSLSPQSASSSSSSEESPQSFTSKLKRFVGINSIFGSNKNEEEGVTRLHFMRGSMPFMSVSYINTNQPQSRRTSLEMEIPASRPSMSVEHYQASSNNKRESHKTYFEHMLTPLNDDKEVNYDPHFLDDPNMRCGYKRKVMNLPGIISSTIPFVKTKALAEELNEQFRDRHGDRITLTLSKIRNMKKKMLNAAFPGGLYNVHHHYHHGYSSSSAHLDEIHLDQNKDSSHVDISTVTLAIVYFERLIINGYVEDKNRKLVAATCLFLAFKLNNEITSAQERSKHLGQLMDQLESSIGVSKKQILQNEFVIFANLNFDLVVPMNQLMPHMKRILEEQGIKLEEYMGEAMYEKYVVRRTVL